MSASCPPEWADRIRRIVDAAPPLTDEQLARIGALLRGRR